MPPIRPLFLMTLLLALTGVGGAQETGGSESRFCSPCKGTGFVPCEIRKCEKFACLYEKKHLCAEQLEFECCNGTKRLPCKFCDTGGAHGQHALQLDLRKVWAEAAKQSNDELRTPRALFISTERFMLHYDVKKIKFDQRTWDRNKGLHIYASRLEELLEDYKKHFGEPYRYPQDGPWLIHMLANATDAARVCSTVCGGNASKLFGQKTSIYVMDADPRMDDEFRHSNVYHHTAHLIAEQGFPIGSAIYPGWWTIGVARWLEIEKFGETRHSCTGEVAAKSDPWQNGKWAKRVYRLVAKEDDPQLSSFCTRGTKQLNYMLHAVSWSMVDFLVREHADKTESIAQGITSGKPTADALFQALGWSLARFQDEWRSYVLKNYGG